MNAPVSRFDLVLDASREAYLNSPIGKARKALAKVATLSGKLETCAAGVGVALTVGNGTEAALQALADALLDLRIACGDVEALVRLVEADA
jgi:hypothetical protein